MTGPCSLTGCDRNAKRWDADEHVCTLHADRWKRNGSFNVTHVRNQPHEARRICAAADCETLEDGWCGYCKLHMTRIRRHGDPQTVVGPKDRQMPTADTHHAWTGSAASYSAVHMRVKTQRGLAKSHICRCGSVAKQWAYDHADPDERTSEFGPYSAKLEHYIPMCVPCHKTFDLAWLKERTS